MRIGAHVDSTDPLGAATARDAETVQFFLTDPQAWKDPAPRDDAEALLASEIDIYIHAPYRINVATLNNRIRIPSRKLLMSHAQGAAAVGAKGLIVHGGHVEKGEDVAIGFDNWRKAFEYAAKSGGFPLPVLIENTAGATTPVPAGSTRWPGCGTRSASSSRASASTPATRTPAGKTCSTPSTGSRRSPAAST
ncbi:hypothetical protein Prum_042420 [Phytohabitans rumicis]|uniref:Xylose isomerase-like TIM barrel domain-containing protein n=1 Tax=Phytohabitans rumicis TaxID=1076125 RepID=A0A6V8L4X0_9ACTN|nr:hypothetical protein Prum_042420 [Phytohabitans rumicis]